MAKVFAIFGTSSHCGKTTLVAAFCRALSNRGFRVAPFKAQNMSLNSYVTPEGGEIARAQALQAFASRTEPSVHMNPVLLKPSGRMRSQLVLLGKPVRDIDAKRYFSENKKELLEIALKSLKQLCSKFDFVVIEGAGSAAEPNLYESDIANMNLAQRVGAPVYIVCDIDRGGCFASFIGTLEIIKAEHRKLVKGFIINKFRGEISLLKGAIEYTERKTGVRVVGVVPYIDTLKLPSEDSVSISSKIGGKIVVAAIRYPYISNFTDLEDFMLDDRFSVKFVTSVEEFGEPSLVILPGSKNVAHDVLWLKKTRLDQKIQCFAQNGGLVIGVCGGYQMLGERIEDPLGIEGGRPATYRGLALLPVVTVFKRFHKILERVEVLESNHPLFPKSVFKGYEIRMGEPKRLGAKPLFVIKTAAGEKVEEGCATQNVIGTSVHGIFESGEVRSAIAKRFLGFEQPQPSSWEIWDKELDRIANVVQENTDFEFVIQSARDF
jgi:adenosylcobyric acid synthase